MNPSQVDPIDREPAQQTNLAELHTYLRDHFSLDELKDLCLDVGVNWEDVGGEPTRSSKARELILLLERRQRLELLVPKIIKRRDDFLATRISIWDELMARLGIVQKWLTKRAVKAIDRGWVSDAEVHETLARVRNLLDRIRQDPDAIDDSLLPALSERLSRKLGTNAPERYRLRVAAPMIALILNSPERLAIDDAISLNNAWKRLTRPRPPSRRAWLCMAVAGCAVAYGVLLVFIQPPKLRDEFGGSVDGPLNERKWEYKDLDGWTTPNDYLEIKGPGLALLKLDALRSRQLDDFTLRFFAQVKSGDRIAWVLRAQQYAPIERLHAYQFAVTIHDSKPARLFIEGKSLPDGATLEAIPDGEIRIKDFKRTDALQVEVSATGSEFKYKFRCQAVWEGTDEREDPKNAWPIYLTLVDHHNTPHRRGFVGLLGPEKAGGSIHITHFYVKPNRKWFF